MKETMNYADCLQEAFNEENTQNFDTDEGVKEKASHRSK
jgi:hypothetical protein